MTNTNNEISRLEEKNIDDLIDELEANALDISLDLSADIEDFFWEDIKIRGFIIDVIKRKKLNEKIEYIKKIEEDYRGAVNCEEYEFAIEMLKRKKRFYHFFLKEVLENFK